MKFELPKDQSSIIKVIGVGGGGSNAVNHMFNQGISGVDFVVCNTDQQALDLSPVPNKLQLGATLTEGLGAGSNPEVGMNAAIESVDDLKEILEKNTQMVFITAGMGGGTGTGAGPIIAKTARDMGILTVGIVTVPFAFEGRRRRQQADQGIDELKQHVDTMLVINNDRLREMYGNLKISEAFAKADDVLTVAAKGIAEIVTVPGYINVDFKDVSTVMKDGGTAIMGSARASGEERATKAISHALSSPLLNDNDITGANYILLNISSSEEEMSMDEVDEITDYIQGEAGYTAELIFGLSHDDSLEDNINVTLIATGFGSKSEKTITGNREPKKIVRSLDDDVPTTITSEEKKEKEEEKENKEKDEEEPYLKNENDDSDEEQVSFEFKLDTDKKNPSSSDQKEKADEDGFIRYSLDEDEDESSSETGSDLTDENKVQDDSDKRVSEDEQLKKSHERMLKLKAISLKMKTPNGINDLENEPAYKRRNVKLDDVPHSSESNVSRYSLSDSEDDEEKKTKLKKNNPFLHDNVD